jgi:hypothetical protein
LSFYKGKVSTIEKKEQRDMNQHATDKNVAGVE